MIESTYPGGGKYFGEWEKSGKRHGIGKLESPRGAEYIGQFEKGIPKGLGVLTLSDGCEYAGEFVEGVCHGMGVLKEANGLKVEGTFVDGKPNGLGLITFPDGTHGIPRYEGHIKGHRLRQREKCPEIVDQSRAIAEEAHLLVLDFTRAVDPPEEEVERAKAIVTEIAQQRKLLKENSEDSDEGGGEETSGEERTDEVDEETDQEEKKKEKDGEKKENEKDGEDSLIIQFEIEADGSGRSKSSQSSKVHLE